MQQKPLQTNQRGATLAGDKFVKNPDLVTQDDLRTTLQNTGSIFSPPLAGEIIYNNTTTLANTLITVSLVETTYQIDATIPFHALTSPLKLALSGSLTAITLNGVWTSYDVTGTEVATLGVSALDIAFDCNVTNQEGFARFIGHVHVGVAGSLVIQGAQTILSTTDTKILQGARLSATRLVSPFLDGHIVGDLGDPTSIAIQPSTIADQGSAVPVSGDAFLFLTSGGQLRQADFDDVGSYTDEDAQDAVGGILLSSSDISLVYDDGTPYITASVLATMISGKTGVSPASGDSLLISDLSDSGDLKKITLGDLLSIIISDGDKGDIVVSGGGTIWTLESGYLPTSANDSIFRVGTVELQSLGAFSSLLLDNGYWTGAKFRHRATGPIAGIHFDAGVLRFMSYASAAAATEFDYSPATQLLIIDPTSAAFTVPVTVPDAAYGVGWNGSSDVPTKNAVYDKIEALMGSSYTDEQAQDAIGAMIDGSLVYVDGTPLLTRAALNGDVNASQGSNTTSIAANAVTFAKMQAVSPNVLLGNDASGTAVEEIACTAAGRALIDDASASDQRTTLGLGNVENTALSTWGGSTSITIVGTVATGTWQGTTIGIGYGGTNATSFGTTDGVVTYDGSKLITNSGVTINGNVVSIAGSGIDTTLRVGTMESQGVGLNNTLINENSFFNGTNWIYRNSGFACAFQMVNGGFTFWTAPSGTGGAAATMVQKFSLAEDGTATFIGNVSAANLSGTNSGDVTNSGETYLTRSGQALTANPVNLSGSHVTGKLKADAFLGRVEAMSILAGRRR